MQIKKYKAFEFEIQRKRYGLFGNLHYQNPISHVQFFLYDCYGYVHRAGGPIQFLNSLKSQYGDWGVTFEMVDLNVDIENNLVYLGEIFDPYEHGMTEQEFNIKYNNMNALQLCQNNIIDCAVMTKDNFVHLLTNWGKFYHIMSPFILLYLDEKNWYDVLPFDSKEAMDKFVVDHTQPELT